MRKHLLMTTAFAGLAFAVSPAMAFDEINWTWNKTVEESVDIVVDITSEINPTGHVEIEDTQFFVGDVVARTNVSGNFLSNDASEPADLTGTVVVPFEVPIEGSLGLTGSYDANAPVANITNADLNADNLEGLNIDSAVVSPESQISVQPSSFQFEIDIEGSVSGEQEVNLSELDVQFDAVTLDATTELANAAGAATAIANFKNIETETATFLDEFQVHEAANGAAEGAGVLAQSTAGGLESPVALAVDLDATAISNLLTVNSAVDDPNNVFIADVLQDTNANMLAEATSVQDLSGFNSLGSYQGLTDSDGNSIAGRVANLTATAIGNFAELKIGPSVDLDQ